MVRFGCRLLSVVGLMALPCISCKPEPPFEISIRVLSDGNPLPGAVVMKGGKDGPATGPDGRVVVKIPGQEGEVVDLMVRCPPDYVSPKTPIGAGLRRIANGKLPEYQTSCPPAVRHLVVAVRADAGPNLPVRVLGRVVGKTDPNGAFTFALPLKPGDGVELTFDTDGIDRITPKNPSAQIVMSQYDDVVTVSQKFEWAPVKKKYVYVRPPPQAIRSMGPRRGI
jgi:hypothetical protein